MIFDVTHCLAKPIGVLARGPEDVEGETLSPFGTNPG
jgi:hypothetical protein